MPQLKEFLMYFLSPMFVFYTQDSNFHLSYVSLFSYIIYWNIDILYFFFSFST